MKHQHMDFSWLVCDAAHLDQIKKDLVAQETQKTDDPDLVAVVTPDERLFVFEYGGGRASLFFLPEERRFLSAGREMMFGELEEQAWLSQFACWKDGREQWRVYHDHIDPDDVASFEERGRPPGNYAVIKKTLSHMQQASRDNEDHLYALAPLLSKDLTGYGAEAELPQGKLYKWDTRPRPNAVVRFIKRLMGG
ncbi:hypothetical protein [Halomonas sp. 707D4]|uniref:hypothetical protein n=1 Tax=Halomonas sp. 707D4 TaxID=1904455 RepID=UPI00209C826E|nr:hypothetical protein [Halomonas sp. 707D4]MCP1326151.1 hypothetical protein [Halomonas sp. 707D4]